VRFQIKGADIFRAVFDPRPDDPEFPLSRPSQLCAVARSLGAPDQDIRLRRKGGKPSMVHLTSANGVASFREQVNTCLQQHGPDDQCTTELYQQNH
jgi:hypothetical protein